MKLGQFTVESELSAIDGASALKRAFPTVIRTGSWPLDEERTDIVNEYEYQLFLVSRGFPFILRASIDSASSLISVTIRAHKSIMIASAFLLTVPVLLSVWLWLTSGPADKDLINILLKIWGFSIFGAVWGYFECWRSARALSGTAQLLLASIARK